MANPTVAAVTTSEAGKTVTGTGRFLRLTNLNGGGIVTYRIEDIDGDTVDGTVTSTTEDDSHNLPAAAGFERYHQISRSGSNAVQVSLIATGATSVELALVDDIR